MALHRRDAENAENGRARHTLMVDASCDYGPRIVGVGIYYMRRQLRDAHKRGVGQDRHDLQGRILRLASQFDEVKFAYQARRKNQNAHRLARRGTREASPTTRSDLFAP